ncbi:hypothetical protein [Bartonella rattaustraliani]|nr:hypothetical protein [Bartonella rattaustraliani]
MLKARAHIFRKTSALSPVYAFDLAVQLASFITQSAARDISLHKTMQ